jgi:hypothetical protein
MPKEQHINIVFPSHLIEQIDLAGKYLMPEGFNAETKRGRSAVIRLLVSEGLARNQSRLRKKIRKTTGKDAVVKTGPGGDYVAEYVPASSGKLKRKARVK